MRAHASGSAGPRGRSGPPSSARPCVTGESLPASSGGRLERALRGETARRRRAVEALAARLDGLSPLACLARGYAIAVSPSGEVLTRADRVRIGERVKVRLHEGSLGCRVEDVDRPGAPAGPGRGESDARHA